MNSQIIFILHIHSRYTKLHPIFLRAKCLSWNLELLTKMFESLILPCDAMSIVPSPGQNVINLLDVAAGGHVVVKYLDKYIAQGVTRALFASFPLLGK